MTCLDVARHMVFLRGGVFTDLADIAGLVVNMNAHMTFHGFVYSRL